MLVYIPTEYVTTGIKNKHKSVITKNKRNTNEAIKVLDIFSGTKSLFKALHP